MLLADYVERMEQTETVKRGHIYKQLVGQSLAKVREYHILKTLLTNMGRIDKTSSQLGVSRRTISRLLVSLDIQIS